MTIKKNDNLKDLILNDPQYINSPKHNNKLKELAALYPNGTPESIACRVLCLTKEEFDIAHSYVIIKLRSAVEGNKDDDQGESS